ncbi:nacrein-like protein [Ostrea edulis]|uniref:nacrein-like protein n=1 Tax=Ostrea edulis TaxID=37623 RepID=UPI0024AE9420|nr:nacrein-like protein [Ostrea edulis]
MLRGMCTVAFSLALVLLNVSVKEVCCFGSQGNCLPTSNKCTVSDIKDARFTYDEDSCHGPENWYKVHSCWYLCEEDRGSRQSPIDIETEEATTDKSLTFSFSDVCTRVDAEYRNCGSGHSPHFEVKGSNNKKIYLSDVPNTPPNTKYVLDNVHIHVGQEEDEGSEHSIDDTFWPMEAHMVFYDSKFPSLGLANSLVAMMVMIEIDGSPVAPDVEATQDCDVRFASHLDFLMRTHFGNSDEYSFFEDDSDDCTFYDEECVKPKCEGGEHLKISPSDVLPSDWSFYSYRGSLTSPGCNEIVEWIALKCPIKVSSVAFNALRNIPVNGGSTLQTHGTRRPIQSNELPIQKNFDKEKTRQHPCPK